MIEATASDFSRGKDLTLYPFHYINIDIEAPFHAIVLELVHHIVCM